MRHSIISSNKACSILCGLLQGKINLHSFLVQRRQSSVKYKEYETFLQLDRPFDIWDNLPLISIYEATWPSHWMWQLSCSNESDKKDCYINMYGISCCGLGRVGFVKTYIAPDPIFTATIWIIIRLKYLMTRPNNTVLCILCSRFRKMWVHTLQGHFIKNFNYFHHKVNNVCTQRQSIVRSSKADGKIIKKKLGADSVA